MPPKFSDWSHLYRHCVEQKLPLGPGDIVKCEYAILPPLDPRTVLEPPKKSVLAVDYETVRYEIYANYLKARVFDEIVFLIPPADLAYHMRGNCCRDIRIAQQFSGVFDNIMTIAEKIKG